MDLLRQPSHAIRAAQDLRLSEMLRLCARGHDFYRQRWEEAGVDVASVRGVEDLERLPLTHKREFMGAPESFRLRLPDLPLEERALCTVVHTTGSTGNPTPVYNTTHDYEANLLACRRAADIVGLRNTDVIANLFPLTPAPMGSFVRAVENAYAIGAAVVGGLTGAPHGHFGVHRSLDDAVRLVARHRATVLWGVPSFLRRVVMRAEEVGADFRSVRMCTLTGEATTFGMREDIRSRLRTLGVVQPTIFDRYGSTEAYALAQCREEAAWHNPVPDLLFHEIVDPDTGRRLPDGERGVLALTHLDRRGTVLIRYVVGDVLSMTHEPCPDCGRTCDRLVGPVVRTKDLMKVKGMLMSPDQLQDAIRSLSGVEEFQVVVSKENPSDPYSMDQLIVRVATDSEDVDQFARELIELVKNASGIRPRIEISRADEIYNPAKHAKAEHFVDLRPDQSATA